MTTKPIHKPFADARTPSLDPSHRAADHAGGRRASRPLLSVITIAVLALTGGCAGTDSAGNGASTAHSDAGEHSFQGTVGLPSPHVHGVAVNPGDGRVYLATHHGLFRYDDTGPTRVGPVIDLMGFTLADPDLFYASGHPGEGTDLPNPVGLLESRDAGRTWSPLSRQDQSDFHALTASLSGVVGSDGTLRASPDGRHWRDLQIASPPTALAASPDGHTVLAATDAGMLRSSDAGQTWAAPPGAPPLKVLSWAADATAVGATFDGAVHVSTDAGVTWQRRGRTPPPQAITATAADGMRVLVVTGENVLDSADGGTTFTPLQSHGR